MISFARSSMVSLIFDLTDFPEIFLKLGVHICIWNELFKINDGKILLRFMRVMALDVAKRILMNNLTQNADI